MNLNDWRYREYASLKCIPNSLFDYLLENNESTTTALRKATDAFRKASGIFRSYPIFSELGRLSMKFAGTHWTTNTLKPSNGEYEKKHKIHQTKYLAYDNGSLEHYGFTIDSNNI